MLTCMCSCVSLQIKGIIESFAAEGAKVALDIRVTLEMPVEKSLEVKVFPANPAAQLSRSIGVVRS